MEDTFRACPFRCILDRPHTKEHLSDVSKRLESKQLISVSAKQWYATAVRRLEHGDVDKLIGELGHAFDRSQDDDIRKQAEYFERNKDAVSYGDYRDHGGSTASSEVDSAHRHVVQKRLKIPGAWWHPDNVRNILALRMLKANRWWDEYWELQRQQWRTRAQRLRNQRLPDNRNPDTEISTPINEGHNLMKTRGSNGFESHPLATRFHRCHTQESTEPSKSSADHAVLVRADNPESPVCPEPARSGGRDGPPAGQPGGRRPHSECRIAAPGPAATDRPVWVAVSLPLPQVAWLPAPRLPVVPPAVEAESGKS